MPRDDGTALLDGGFRLVVVLAAVCGLLLVGTVLGPHTGTPAAAGASVAATGSSAESGPAGRIDLSTFLYGQPRQAAPIDLIDQDGKPFSLAGLRGEAVLVFFGYTHCPDVCPATIGRVGEALAAVGAGTRAVFVTIDPQRDTTGWLSEYARYMPRGFTALTGTAEEIRRTADAWGVKYARVETGNPEAYSMSHTADVFLVDANGWLRAHFPFGTEEGVMAAGLRELGLDPLSSGSSPSPSASASALASSQPSTDPVAPFTIRVVSSAIWAGGPSPVILRLGPEDQPVDDPHLRVSVQLETASGAAVGAPVVALAVQPPGETIVSFVALIDIPAAGPWLLAVRAESGTAGAAPDTSTVPITALDQGDTARIGSAAPETRTPTLDDVGGVARAITTDPAPDLRLSQRSTADALADHTPFVLVADSVKFRVSPACGKAVVLARYLLDRWPAVTFVHLEPYRYAVITDTPVLDGDLADPPMADPALAWGLGGTPGSRPWDSRSMPWVFIVDGDGVIRAKYQGVVGSDDVDVILSLIAQGD